MIPPQAIALSGRIPQAGGSTISLIGGWGGLAGVNPADVTIASPVNHIQLSRPAIAKNQQRLIG